MDGTAMLTSGLRLCRQVDEGSVEVGDRCGADEAHGARAGHVPRVDRVLKNDVEKLPAAAMGASSLPIHEVVDARSE